MTNSAEHIFNKSYKPIFTVEIFIIDKVNHAGHPITYLLKDLDFEAISGIVYRNEIVPVARPIHFDIEGVEKKRICKKTKKRQLFVKYIGYPPKFNQWLDEEALVEKIPNLT